MRLCLDSGNSRLKWGVHDGVRWLAQGASAQGDAMALAAVCAEWPNIHEVYLANVAGAVVEENLRVALGSLSERLHVVRPAARGGGVRNGYRNPGQLGVDRWCALVGARAQQAGALVVVMAGTATTVDTLSAAGEFLGGLILPGIDLMLRSLSQGTADLPFASGVHVDYPRCTDDAIVSGALEAQVGAVERAWRRLAAADAMCLLSGGNAERLAACLTAPHRVVVNLPLEGLRCLAEENAADSDERA